MTTASSTENATLETAIRIWPKLERLRAELRENRERRAVLLHEVHDELRAAKARSQVLREWVAREILKEAEPWPS